MAALIIRSVVLTVLLQGAIACALASSPADEPGRAVPARPAASAASARPVAAASAVAPAVAVAASAAVVPGRTYAPAFLPRELQFSPQEIEAIRAAVAKQMVAYHQAEVERNDTFASFQRSERERWTSKANYDIWAAQHTRRVFERQAVYTQLIFWMVILLVASGVALTWYQFLHDSSFFSLAMRAWLKSVRPGTGPEPAGLPQILDTLRAQQSLEIGKDGLKITTRVLGLLTLAISMGFFYLYLRHVYPINIKDTTTVAAGVVQKADAK